MNFSLWRAACAALALGLAPLPLLSQVPLTPRALGMGGAYIGVARGQEALFQNPANLGLAGNPVWSVALPQLAVGGTVLGPTFGILPDLAQYDNLAQSRRDEILGLIPESGTEAELDLRLPVAAIQFGGLALGVSYGVVGQHSLGKDLVDLVINGYQEGRTDYTIGNTRGSRASFVDVAAGFGRRVGPLSLGVTGHYVMGRTLMRSKLFEPRILVDEQDIEVEYVSVRADGGTGFGVDVGAALQPHPTLTLSAAVQNAYSQMKWSDDLTMRRLVLRKGDFEDADPQTLGNKYEGSEQKLASSSVPLSVYETAEGLYDQAYFPSTLHVGAAWAPRSSSQLAFSFQRELTPGRLNGWWDQSASLGAQQKLLFLTARAGYATDLDGRSMISGGLSLGPIQLGLARLNNGEAAGATRNGWITTFGLSAKGKRIEAVPTAAPVLPGSSR